MGKREEVIDTIFIITEHAAERYVERFAGNVTKRVAAKRLKRIVASAHRKRTAPGGATVYATKGIEFVVDRGRVLTVYGVDTKPMPYAIEA